MTPEKRLLLIDWWSYPQHDSFNNNFIEIVSSKYEILNVIIFNENCKIKHPRVKLVSARGRLRRFLKVKALVSRVKQEGCKIVFLSYDPLFIPFVKSDAVFEHNTVPEGRTLIKHLLYQRLFFKKVNRLTVSYQQQAVLLNYGMASNYVGTPLCYKDIKKKQLEKLVALSYRTKGDGLLAAGLQKKYKLILRKGDPLEDQFVGENVEFVNNLNIDACCYSYFVDDSSAVRMSGWIMEAISRACPLVFESDSTRYMVALNYRHFDHLFIRPGSTTGISIEAHADRIGMHNEELLFRFETSLKAC